MRQFRFRAQAALDLRRREHDRALVDLAHAQTAVAVARRGTEEAEAAVRDTEQRLSEALRTPSMQAALDWYRSWRARCCSERDKCSAHERTCEDGMRAAERAVHEARRRVRSLERLHDNSLAAWRHAAHLEEQKAMDALGASRFARRKESV